ncbi:hypothetical protein EJ05DRAFT_504920 [Pseudovirgaria hyperparasitica]|uniref:NB-ARC domain-containing protein n=1 Tax=Pseudovirgaria hyperparasitica TaxID=470096 RepID=A0A6A6VVI4_9PEZI|nr:uncharacterized protein EJ05DRAFT_504920 [Pseudovirgaria hyperparasitica]KAF2753267.1 hypothetical protein EJ05DRAFT_504920 [Pseudovirgaria hyperparasitica]
MATYDEIYVQSWQEALKKCERVLEKHDHDRALRVKSLQNFRTELNSLLTEFPDEEPRRAITLIQPTLDHYEIFAQNFVNMMQNPVDTSMMWGLLFIVFKLALGSTGPLSPLRRVSRWLEKIGHKLRTSNDCSDRIIDVEKVKGDTVEVNKEIVLLWLNVIMTFRLQGGRETQLDDCTWESLTRFYNTAYQNIDDAIKRIEKVADMAERQARHMNELALFQRLLTLEETRNEEANLECDTLPVAQNKQFFGRKDILHKLDEHLSPTNTTARLASIALYGLGGIGKTQTALAYAYSKLHDFDVVLWISAEDSYSVQQGFSRAALEALKLPQAKPHAYQENMILVLNWLQKTSAKWLLIFDNVDSHEVIDDCWPAAKHGSILVTTRDVVVATLPIETGVEVSEFEPKEGAEFLIHTTPRRRRMDGEFSAAHQIASNLGGLPLALNQMAALINARNYSLADFSALYSRNSQRLHKEKRNGYKYLGYNYSLDTVWELSFNALGDEARACLGVLSFLAADSAPIALFTDVEPGNLPDILSFCKDELSFDDALEQLTHHALIRKNIDEGTFRIHRLVQSEYRSRMENPQEQFEAATRLLLEKFPPERSNQYNDEEWLIYERYIPSVLALVRDYNDSQKNKSRIKPNMNFVKLLANAVNAIHDNDTTNVIPGLLDTSDDAYSKCSDDERDRLLLAFLLSLKCMHHFSTAEFARAEKEMTEGLEIRLRLLDPDDLLISLSYSWLGMAVGAQLRYAEGLDWLLKAGEVLDGPAGKIPTRRMVWGYNIACNYYCMGRFEEAERHLANALADADRLGSWYMHVYGHLTYTSLRTRMRDFKSAQRHVHKAKEVLEISGSSARFSWLSSYCAYRAGDVAFHQGRVAVAIEESEKAIAIGKLTKVPASILARCTHAYSKALACDATRREDSERQRQEARRLRTQIPGGGGDLDDESDEAFERLIKMDHR